MTKPVRGLVLLALCLAAWGVGIPASHWYDRQRAARVQIRIVSVPDGRFDCAFDPAPRECRLPMRDGPYVLVGPASLGQ